MKQTNHSSTRGILHANAGMEKFKLFRFEPCTALQPFVEHYWIVRYNLDKDIVFQQTVLSYPNINIAFEHDSEGRRALIYGVPQRPFVRELRDAGKVLGIKFRAGGFYPFWKQPVYHLNGKTIAATALLESQTDPLTTRILDTEDHAEMAELAEQALLQRLPNRDFQSELVGQIVDEAKNNRQIIKVEQLSMQYELSVRSLQRLFQKYVGMSPKWVIKRFRLQEAAERLELEDGKQWSALAVELGYFDQAHFIKDFKAVIGQSPVAYKKAIHHV